MDDAGDLPLLRRLPDQYGNTYELEVMTPNLEGGTGSTWMNSMRHRETYMQMQVLQDGFIVRTEDGVAVQFQCQAGDS